MEPLINTRLPDRAVLSLEGPDTVDLLQGLVTANIANLAQDDVAYAALLTPQGKVLCAFFVWRTARGVLLELPLGEMSALKQRLTLYKLRANVTMEEAPHGVFIGDDAPAAGRDDPRLAALGRRWLGEGDDAGGGLVAYRARRIALGVPEFGGDYGPGEVFPMDVNLDALRAVDYKKGCFVGQEVASRMFRKGSVRKRSWCVTAEEPLAVGAEIVAGSSTLGTITSAAGKVGIALVRVDRVDAAKGAPTVCGQPVRLTAPSYLK